MRLEVTARLTGKVTGKVTWRTTRVLPSEVGVYVAELYLREDESWSTIGKARMTYIDDQLDSLVRVG
jgi:hypothetical protein